MHPFVSFGFILDRWPIGFDLFYFYPFVFIVLVEWDFLGLISVLVFWILVS